MKPMSKTLSPRNAPSPADLHDLADGGFEKPNIDPTELLIAAQVGHVRGQILAAMNDQNVGVRELARRLNVSASAVSRQLKSEGDMRISTAILLAYALEREWTMNLQNTINSARYSAVINTPEFITPQIREEMSTPPDVNLPRSETFAPHTDVRLTFETA